LPFYLDYNTAGGVTIQPGANQKGLLIQLAASPTQDALDIYNSASAILFSVANQGHLVGGGSQITVTTGAALGSSGNPTVTVTTGSTDTRGSVFFGTGGTTVNGTILTVNYANNYSTAPYVNVTLSVANTTNAVGTPYIVSSTTANFVVGCTTLTASVTNPAYGIYYEVIG